jgi:hypothetical protein
MQPTPSPSSFATRLSTFQDQWPSHQTTARQLAALGHVCDRPPLECLEEGSRCIDCGHFLPMETSVSALESSLVITNSLLTFHEPKCTRLQLRMPLEATRSTLDYSSLVSRWERRSHATPPTTSLRPPHRTPPPNLLLHPPQRLLPNRNRPFAPRLAPHNHKARLLPPWTARQNKSKPPPHLQSNLLRSPRLIIPEYSLQTRHNASSLLVPTKYRPRGTGSSQGTGCHVRTEGGRRGVCVDGVL